jgi:hypothetical protein
MDPQRKTIQTLALTLDAKREELASLYRRFGERLIADSSDPLHSAVAVPAERIAAWKDLMEGRETGNLVIIDIKAALARQQELSVFRKELERNLAGENTHRQEQFERLGELLFEQYEEGRDEKYFGRVHKEASRTKELIARLEEKNDQLQLERARSGFFGKIIAQFRIGSLSATVRQHRGKFLKVVGEGARSLAESGDLEKLIVEGTRMTELSVVYSGIRETEERLERIRLNDESLQSDMDATVGVLDLCGAAGNPARRIEELKRLVTERDRSIDALTILCAREYSDKFLDEDGKSLLGDTADGNTFSDMGSYAHQLEQVARARSEISATRRRIEVLETSVRIEAIDRSVKAAERTIVENGRKIRLLEESTQTLRKSIADAAVEREKLLARRDSIADTLRKAP